MLPMHFSTFRDCLDSWGFTTQKFSSSISMTKTHMTKNFHKKKKKKKNSHMLKKNSQDATHVSKNSISRQKTHVNFFFPTTKTHMTKNCYQPKIMRPKRSMPHQKFHHNQNVSHIHTQLPNLFFITMHKNFYMTKIANK